MEDNQDEKAIAILLALSLMLSLCACGSSTTKPPVSTDAPVRAGEDSGYSLSEKCKIDTFKAIAVSYETFDGETWENPYYKEFCSLYEGQRLG